MDAMERGSEQLLSIWKEQRGVTEEDVLALAEGLDGLALEQAAVSGDVLSVRGRVAIDDCGNVVNSLLARLRKQPPVPVRIEIFPLGTPVPTEVAVRVGLGADKTVAY